MTLHSPTLLRIRVRAAVAATVISIGVLFAASAGAQDLSNLANMTPDQIRQIMQSLPPDQQQKLQQMLQSQGGQTTPQQQQPVVLTPAAPPAARLAQSQLEKIISGRAGTMLQQFGYDQVGIGSSVSVSQTGAVQDNYVLGPGDEIDVTLRGQENSQYSTTVDRNGQVILPRLSPIPAAGQTLGEFRRAVQDAVHRAYVSTEATVTVGQLRQVTVTVAGEVSNPGVRILTASSTPLDAILLSGGVKKTGSLRRIRILRGGKESTLDLYSVLIGHGRDRNVMLADGDQIVVPPLGPTVAVSGWVRRPAIYELAAGQSAVSVQSLLSLAGGLQVRGRYNLSVLRVLPDGRTQMMPVEGQSGSLQDSEILFAMPAADRTVNQATLSGGMTLAGPFSLKNTKLSDLLKQPGALGDSPYTLFGIISRKDPITLLRTLIAFTPVSVLQGKNDMILQSDDIVRPITTDEARSLFAAIQAYNKSAHDSQEALRNPLAASAGAGNLSAQTTAQAAAVASGQQSGSMLQSDMQALNTAGQAGNAVSNIAIPGTANLAQVPAQNLQTEMTAPDEFASNRQASTPTQLASQLNVDPLVLMNFLNDTTVTVDGAVRGPGMYLVGPDADLQSLIAASGGLSRWADRSALEIISTSINAETGEAQTRRRTVSLAGGADAGFIVLPHDQVRVNEIYTAVGIGSVTVQGQVRHVGTYQIVRGEHLSDVLMRAGGLTESAYPYGTIFLRKSAAELEQDAFRREAREIQDQLLVAMGRRDPNAKLSPDVFTALQSFINQLKTQKALGRVSIIADPVMLAANPAKDPLMEAGDVIYVPQRPYTVSVLGEVLQPGSVPFDPHMSASDYIDRVGGYSQFADESETILVLPDGTARQLERSWLNIGGDDIPPGSTIYVARDISGIDLHQIIADTTSIVSQLAVTAASLAVLSKQ
jgi:polysaccharide biosynthesis/export protein